MKVNNFQIEQVKVLDNDDDDDNDDQAGDGDGDGGAGKKVTCTYFAIKAYIFTYLHTYIHK